jgi:hypothetical protein
MEEMAFSLKLKNFPEFACMGKCSGGQASNFPEINRRQWR